LIRHQNKPVFSFGTVLSTMPDFSPAL